MNRRSVGRLALAAVCMSVMPTLARAQAATAGGEVAKIDKATGRLTLKHDGIKNLDMPPMLMAFRVRDPKMLDGLSVGDRVRFVAERVDGQYTVMSLSKAP